ncbi:hypothetical protein Tco_0005506 [Tanacetum coccineum]
MQQLMQNPKDSSDPTTAMNMELALIAKAFKVNTIRKNNNQRSSLIPRNSQIAQPGMNTSQDIKMQMVDDNVGNQVIYNVVQNNGNEVGQNAVQNPVIQIVENINRLSVVLEIANQFGNGNVVTTPAKGNGNGINADADAYEETKRVKVNCTLEDTLQQASTSETHSDNASVYDSDGSTEVPKDESCYDHDIFNMLTHKVQYIDLQTELDRTKEKLENCIIKKEEEYNVLWNNCCKQSWEISRVRSYAKENEQLKMTYKNLFDSSKVTQAQTKSIIDSFQKQLHDTIYENAKLRAQLSDKVSEQKGTTKGTRTNTMFIKQSILRKPPSSYKPKLYSVTPFPKSSVLPKVDKMNALSKPVTSNSTPATQESKVVQTVNVIAPRIFRTNPSKTFRVDNVVPNKPVKISVRIKPITVSQPNVIHKQQANFDSNSFSSTRVNNTAKTRRPHPRSNSNTDRVPSKSKSSCLSNKVEKIKENHKNSQIPKNQKHMSSECNNITLAIRNAKSEIVCVMCKQCLVTTNHDVCVLNYVNADNQSANVTIREYQKKYKANAKNSKELRSKGSLASSRPSKPRTCLRWIPTGRIFAMCGKES